MAAPPDLNIPPSQNTVEVFIIDTTSHVRIDASRFIQPTIPGHERLNACCYSFLIKRHNPTAPSKYDTLVFDLGVRKDFQNGPKVLADMASSMPSDTLRVEKDVATILSENGVSLDTVGGIIWSHHHFDHTGDPSTFPPSTDLVVGPGFKQAFVPAYPTDPTAAVDERAWSGRELVEISFSTDLRIGPYPAHDFHGDGSFYLLDTPGHAIGHVCGLARTSSEPAEFLLLGGDIAHHGGEFRPTTYLPLPEEIRPHPLEAPFAAPGSACPGAIFEAVHPTRSSTEPFYRVVEEGGVHADGAVAQASLDGLQVFDAWENVFVAIAHDRGLYDVVEYFPKRANEWRKKGWKREGRWRFLRDFELGEGVQKEARVDDGV